MSHNEVTHGTYTDDFRRIPDSELRDDWKHDCGSRLLSVRTWDSSCGGWTDEQYRCDGCGKTWWVEGIDS